jgi:hypothetical protein
MRGLAVLRAPTPRAPNTTASITQRVSAMAVAAAASAAAVADGGVVASLGIGMRFK